MSGVLETFEAFSGLIAVFCLLGWILSAIFIWLGTKVSRLENAGLRRSLLRRSISASFFATILVYLTTSVFLVLPPLPALAGFFLGVVLSWYAIWRAFQARPGEVLVVWLFGAGGQVLAAALGTAIFVGGFNDLLKIL